MNFNTFIESINWLQITLLITITILYLYYYIVLSYYRVYRLSTESLAPTDDDRLISKYESIHKRRTIIIVLMLFLYGFLIYTTISQYVELKMTNKSIEVGVGEILLIVIAITLCLILLIISIAIVFIIYNFVLNKLDIMNFSFVKRPNHAGSIPTVYKEPSLKSKYTNEKFKNININYIKKTALEFIANDDSSKAIKYLMDFDYVLESKILNSVRLNSSKLKELTRNKHLDLLSTEEYSLQKSKIDNSLIQTVNEINENTV